MDDFEKKMQKEYGRLWADLKDDNHSYYGLDKSVAHTKLVNKIFIKEKFFNEFKVSDFIGKNQNHGHLGILSATFEFLDRIMCIEKIQEYNNHKIEILYTVEDVRNNIMYYVGICDKFDIIGRDDFIPIYNIIAKFNLGGNLISLKYNKQSLTNKDIHIYETC